MLSKSDNYAPTNIVSKEIDQISYGNDIFIEITPSCGYCIIRDEIQPHKRLLVRTAMYAI